MLSTQKFLLQVLSENKQQTDLLQEIFETNSFYLKDFHAFAHFRELKAIELYELDWVHELDWLNQFWEQKHKDSGIDSRDFKFVYLGTKDSMTLLHSDVFGSYSWSINVFGQKHWLLFPPSVSHYFFDEETGEQVKDILNVSIDEKTRFPCIDRAWKARIELIQNPGEMIFVPSGWFHQVRNLQDTLSVNQNWGNPINISWMLKCLLRELKRVQAALSDCYESLQENLMEWDEISQTALAASFGMNLFDFCEYACFSSRKILDSWDSLIFHRMISFGVFELESTLEILRLQSCLKKPFWIEKMEKAKHLLTQARSLVSTKKL
jgi:hypothetical protein